MVAGMLENRYAKLISKLNILCLMFKQDEASPFDQAGKQILWI